MSLGTFGAILGHALALERDATAFYKENDSPDQDGLGAALTAACLRRVERLERLRREGVSEMILESIQGFEEKDFPLTGKPAEAQHAWRERAAAIEETRRRFYETAAAKVPIREVGRQFARMAKENAEAIVRLREEPAGPKP